MKVEEFAAKRRGTLTVADDALRDVVQEALGRYGEDEWYGPIVDVAAQLWLENFQAEAPGARYEGALAAFRASLSKSLAKTTDPGGEVTDGKVERVTRWASTFTVNSATIRGAYSAGVRGKMWVTMHDSAVRSLHTHLDGVVRPIGGVFNVGGAKLAYPGEPVGPPEGWIECRCVAMPAARPGGAMTANTFTLAADAVIGEDEDMEDQEWTTAVVVFVPHAADPIVEASSEPAHVTAAFLGEIADIQEDELALIMSEVEAYAAKLDGPVIAPVQRQGELGDDGALVAFLEPTDPLLAMRAGLLELSPTLSAVLDRVEQHPQWTPHITLGYPGTPPRGEYVGDQVELTKVGLWFGGERTDFLMGGEGVVADAGAPEVDSDPEADLDDGSLDDPTEIPVHGVLAPEGVETGDGRGFRAGALSVRKLPLPLRLEVVGSHGGNQTSEVVTVGRVDEAWRDEATSEWRFRGAIILSKPHADAALSAIIDGSGTGVSIDADAMAVDGSAFDDEVEMDPAAMREPTTWFSQARIAGLTIVPIPAFEQAYIGLGLEFPEDMSPEQLAAAASVVEDCGCADEAPQVGAAEADVVYAMPEMDDAAWEVYDNLSPDEQDAWLAENATVLAAGSFAPGTKDGPGWVTHPRETARIRRYWTRGKGAAKIAWGVPGDFDRCRRALSKYVQNPEWLAGLCANMHKEAIGVWPGQEGGGRGANRSALIASGATESPMLTLIASADEPSSLIADGGRAAYPAEWFDNPRFGKVTSMHIDRETGRIWGHLAQWSSCHVGIAGVCQKPPHSPSNYARFMKGVVDTDGGERRVGCLTYGIGHADPRMRASAATAHYDKLDSVMAYVAIGDDQFGIWYSGVIRPGVSDDDIDMLRAIGALSGDWRNDGSGLDLIAAVAVNTGGYPVPAFAADNGVQMSLVAAGYVEPEVSIAEGEDEFFERGVRKALRIMENRQRADSLRARAFKLRERELRERATKGQ